MTTLSHLTNSALIASTKALVQEELRIGLQVLEHLREVERRRLYLERGHSSLFAFCLRELGYSEPQAQLRIDAMRAMRDNPQITARIESGELSVTAVARIQRFLRNEKVRIGKPLSTEARGELFDKIEGRSLREVDRILAAISSESTLPIERERVISDEYTELRLVIPEDLRLKLEELKAHFSHRTKDPNSTTALLEVLATDALKKIKGSTIPEKTIAPISPKVRSRFIPLHIRRAVWQRDQAQCTYRDPETGQRCDAKRYLQIDHLQPFSEHGATHDLSALRLLCGPHNRLMWEHQRQADSA